MADDLIPWSHPLSLSEAIRTGSFVLDADEDARKRIARSLDLPSVSRLHAELSVRAWLDGAEILGRLEAEVEQTCGVTLDPFPAQVAGVIELQLLPAGSPNAAEVEGEEMELDPDAPDPPDLLEGETFDLGHYVVEHLALALDPFPRKPGAEFDYQPSTKEESPFAVLKALKRDDGAV